MYEILASFSLIKHGEYVDQKGDVVFWTMCQCCRVLRSVFRRQKLLPLVLGISMSTPLEAGSLMAFILMLSRETCLNMRALTGLNLFT